jgi:hypothetical protein
MHESVFANEQSLRVMLANTLARGTDGLASGDPRRQNRRKEYLEEALRPFREDFSDEAYQKLFAALSLVFGTEAMIVFRDVLRMTADEAREIKSWALKALVRAALAESGKSRQNR